MLIDAISLSNLYHRYYAATYEARTLLGLGVSRCWTCISVRHRHDTYDYIELCDFIKLLSVTVCQCPCPYPCFI